jgi:hypothetical protein
MVMTRSMTALAEHRRAVALAAVRPRFLERCREWGECPDAPHLAAVLTSMASSWALRQWPAGGGTPRLFGPATDQAGGELRGRFGRAFTGVFSSFDER